MLAQRAALEGPRWTRAVEDRSAPIPEEITSELGGSIDCMLADRARSEFARSMRAIGDRARPPLEKKYERAWRDYLVVAALIFELDADSKEEPQTHDGFRQ